MATTTKKTNSDVAENTTTAIEKENEELKKKLAEMESNMKLIMESLLTKQDTQAKSVEEDREIEVYNLAVGQLLLSTNGKSDGRKYHFAKQFDMVPIPESDLKEIVRAMRKTAIDGLFYIDDKEFIRQARLVSAYKNILNNVQLGKIYNANKADFIETYRKANKMQKSIIESMITNRVINGDPIDANILVVLSNETGKDFLHITPLPDEYKAMKED